MKAPRGPVLEGEFLTREWIKAFERLARDKGLENLPRSPFTPELNREWLRWFEATGQEAPRAPFTDVRGEITDDWLNYLEAL